MKKTLLVIVALMSAALVVMTTLWLSARSEAKRLASNQSTLLNDARAYTVRDSLNALSEGVLRFELDELRKYRSADAQLIKDMGLRLSRVNSVSKLTTEGLYDIVAPLTLGVGSSKVSKTLTSALALSSTPASRSAEYPCRFDLYDSVFASASTLAMADALRATARDRSQVLMIDYHTPHIDITGEISPDTLTASIEVRDTLVQVLHRVPRFKFLGMWFGTKAVRQEIVSKNPHTRIVAAEYIEITK